MLLQKSYHDIGVRDMANFLLLLKGLTRHKLVQLL